jgi:signal transduction histidine kinase
MSHELRTPLNSIIGFSNVMLRTRGAPAPDSARIYLERIRDNGMHLLVLINDLLDMARIEVGRIPVNLESVDVVALARELAADFEVEARERGLALVVEAPTAAASIETDPSRLRQVVANLVANALKFTNRGRVVLRVVVDEATAAPARIDVEDTGIGIPAERLDAVFAAFEQAESGTERRYGGAGLGLAIARALCELLGFRLEVRSEVGVGSTFSVVLAGEGGPGAQLSV